MAPATFQNLFRPHRSPTIFNEHTKSLGDHFSTPFASSPAAKAALATGLTIWQLIALVLQFGPQILAMIPGIMAVLKAPGGPTIDSIEGLIQQDGPVVYAMVVAIAGLFGIQLPAPTVPTA